MRSNRDNASSLALVTLSLTTTTGLPANRQRSCTCCEILELCSNPERGLWVVVTPRALAASSGQPHSRGVTGTRENPINAALGSGTGASCSGRARRITSGPADAAHRRGTKPPSMRCPPGRRKPKATKKRCYAQDAACICQCSAVALAAGATRAEETEDAATTGDTKSTKLGEAGGPSCRPSRWRTELLQRIAAATPACDDGRPSPRGRHRRWKWSGSENRPPPSGRPLRRGTCFAAQRLGLVLPDEQAR